MSSSRSRLLRIALAAASLALAPALVRAQSCSISGATSFCGPTTELCGPVGTASTLYVWSGLGIVSGTPDGRCITISDPGTYSLQMFDSDTGIWSDPCSVVITHGTGPTASISGPTAVCSGTPVTLCGPDGSLTYAWTGPGGMTASTPCIAAADPGDYTLVVTDAASGCTSAPVTQTLVAGSCGARTAVNCPRPAFWWARGCAPQTNHAGPASATLGAVSACVDDHVALFDWADDRSGFCGTERTHPGDLRARAVRQFVAVEANVCASGTGMTAAPDAGIGLDLATVLAMAGTSGTVGDWLAQSEAQLGALSTRRLHDDGVRDAYRAIVRVGWSINHGHGIGPVCGRPDSGASTLANASGSDADVEEPLDAELRDDDATIMTLEQSGPNPFRGATRVALTLSEPTTQDVAVGVYDLTGRLVRQLANGPLPAGRFEVSWDGRDASGATVPTGVYFVMGRVGGDRIQTRLTLLR